LGEISRLKTTLPPDFLRNGQHSECQLLGSKHRHYEGGEKKRVGQKELHSEAGRRTKERGDERKRNLGIYAETGRGVTPRGDNLLQTGADVKTKRRKREFL